MAMTEQEKKEIKDVITEAFKSQREWLEATINPINKSLDKHADIVEKVPIIEQKLDHHIEAHNSNNKNIKFNIEMWVIVGVFIFDKITQYIKP